MTKTELLEQLAIKFYKVPADYELISHKDNIKEYRIFPWVKNGDDLYKKYVGFCVENEGMPEENAYWSGGEPLPNKIVTFFDNVSSFANEKIADGTVKAAFLQYVDIVNKKALFTVITSSNLKKDAFIYESTAGVLAVQIL